MTTYTNIGFIKDLVEILYIETNYKTWEDIKYTKRLYRFLVFLTFYILSSEFFKTKTVEEQIGVLGNIKNAFINKNKNFTSGGSNEEVQIFKILEKHKKVITTSQDCHRW